MTDKQEFLIILWSSEDIKIDNIELKRSIESEAPGADVTIINIEDIKQMGLRDLKKFLDTYSENSALIISSSKQDLQNVDFWKLGFVMGKMSLQGINKVPIFAFLKGEKNSFFEDLRELCFETCDSEVKIKREMKLLMKDIGISTKFDIEEFKSAKKISEKDRVI